MPFPFLTNWSEIRFAIDVPIRIYIVAIIKARIQLAVIHNNLWCIRIAIVIIRGKHRYIATFQLELLLNRL